MLHIPVPFKINQQVVSQALVLVVTCHIMHIIKHDVLLEEFCNVFFLLVSVHSVGGVGCC